MLSTQSLPVQSPHSSTRHTQNTSPCLACQCPNYTTKTHTVHFAFAFCVTFHGFSSEGSSIGSWLSLRHLCLFSSCGMAARAPPAPPIPPPPPPNPTPLGGDGGRWGTGWGGRGRRPPTPYPRAHPSSPRHAKRRWLLPNHPPHPTAYAPRPSTHPTPPIPHRQPRRREPSACDGGLRRPVR